MATRARLVRHLIPLRPTLVVGSFLRMLLLLGAGILLLATPPRTLPVYATDGTWLADSLAPTIAHSSPPTTTTSAPTPIAPTPIAPTPIAPAFDHNYDVELEILVDGSVVVTETQVIEFVNRSCGYSVRWIPRGNFDYIDGWRVTEADRLFWRVGGQSRPYTFVVSEEADGYDIKWCYPETSARQRTFSLRYVIHGLLTPHDSKPEQLVLAWMAVPDTLEFPVLSSRVRVAAPPGFEFVHGNVVIGDALVLDDADALRHLDSCCYVSESQHTIPPYTGLRVTVVLAPTVAAPPPVAPSTPAPPLPALEVYTNTLHHWAIAYPAAWTVDDSDLWDVSFAASRGGPECRVTLLFLDPSLTLQESVDDYYEYMQEAWAEEDLTFTYRQQPVTVPSGEVGVEVVTEVETRYREHALEVLVARRLYVVNCVADIAEWPEWEAAYEEIIHSFALLPLPISQLGDDAHILAHVDTIRATLPTLEDTFDVDKGRWLPISSEEIPATELEIQDGQALVCSDARKSVFEGWVLDGVYVEDFYAEVEILNLLEDEELCAGMTSMSLDGEVLESTLWSYEEDIGYTITRYPPSDLAEPALLAEGYLMTLMTEEEAKSLQLGVLMVNDEMIILVDDQVVTIVAADEPVDGTFFLFAMTPKGCHLAFDNFSLWTLDKMSLSVVQAHMVGLQAHSAPLGR